MIRSSWTLLLGLALASTAQAQPAVPEVPVTKLSISPMAAPVPALRYKLLPELRDTTPGNAALLYYRAFSPEWWSGYRRDPKTGEMLGEAIQWPLDKLRHMTPDETSQIGWVRDSKMLQEVDRAARRAYCDWEMTPRLREDGVALLLPDIQSMREYVRLLAVRARMEIADGRFDKAGYTVQTGLQMGRHVADAPTLIQGLVGTAISAVMLGQAEEWIQTPGSPNLYWALTNLPQPFIDMRKAFQGERLMLDNLAPGIREALLDPDAKPALISFTDPKWRLALGGDGSVASMTLMVAKRYGAAKDFLRQQGRTAEQIESLPTLQTVLMYEVATYDRLYDEMIKYQGLPHAQAGPALQKFDQQLKVEVSQSSGSWLAGMLLPAAIKVEFAGARLERRIASLRTIEAIRLYAAAHGKLPSKLDDLEVPLPMDSFTGKPFEYQLEGDKAKLTGPPPAGGDANAANSLRFEITLRK